MCYHVINEYVWCAHSTTNLACEYKGVPEMDFASRDRCPGRKPPEIIRHESICLGCSKPPGTGSDKAMEAETMNTAPFPKDENRREATESANTMMAKYHPNLSEVSGPQLSNEFLGFVRAPLRTSHEV